MAAVTLDGDTYCCFVTPGEHLPQRGTNIHCLYLEDNKLYRNGRVLPSIGEEDALNKFNNWLKTFKKQIIMVFYNGFSYDGPLLARFYKKHEITLTDNVKYFADTLFCSRDLFKDTVNHKLRTLAAYFAVEQTVVYDALDDSLALKRICEYLTARAKTHLAFLIGEYLKTF